MSNGQVKIVPTGTWDTHLHVLDPEAFPYSPNRLYTPAPASLEELIAATCADCFLVVQASVEDGTDAILHHLQTARARFPTKKFRAEIEIPLGKSYSDRELAQMNDLGVRAIRLHGVLGSDGNNVAFRIQRELIRLAAYARRVGWCLSCMCELETWNDLVPWLLSSPDVQDVKIVAEHNARIDPSRNGTEYPELDRFLALVAQEPDRFFVKICGLNRLETKEDIPGRIAEIPSPILTLIKALPDQVFWGSDWPHTQFEKGSMDPVPNKTVDLKNELNLLNQALTPEIIEKLFVSNAERLFN